MSKRAVFGTLLTLVLVSMFSSVFNIQLIEAMGTINIRADGSIDPPAAPISTFDNVTYTLTGNITPDADGIVIERDNIVVDGAGYTVQGTGSGYGIYLSNRSSVTIKNTNIKDCGVAIWLDYSSNNSIVENSITNNSYGIELYIGSLNNSIVGNNITDNQRGIWLEWWSNYNSIVGNVFVNDGLAAWDFYGNVVVDNLVNGKPLVYLEDTSDIVVEDAGQVLLVNCTRIKVENLNLSNTAAGVQLWRTSYTTIAGNNITNNKYEGIRLRESSNNSIVGNNITDNICGIVLDEASDNRFYHNNFMDNNQQVSSDGYANVWDNGYPSGGNYWGDYNGADANHDGIGDTPYVIDASNIDNYPLIVPTVIPEFPSFLVLALFIMATLLAVIVYRRKHLYSAGRSVGSIEGGRRNLSRCDCDCA